MSLYLRGRIWWSEFMVRGKRRQFSTRKRDYQEALEAERRIMAPFLLTEDARVMVEVAQKAASAMVSKGRAKISAKCSLFAAFDKYPRLRRDGLPKADSTLQNAFLAWRQFCLCMQDKGRLCLGDVTDEDAAGYMSSLAPRWRQVAYHVLKNVYEGNEVPHPFGRKPARIAGDVQHREALTSEQVRSLLDVAEARTHNTDGRSICAEYPLFLRFLLYTGLRLGDAATAEVSQVDYFAETLERVMAKTGRRVTIPLHPSLVAGLPRSGVYLFPEIRELYVRGKGAVTHQISKLMRLAGICGPKQAYCAHSLRTTFAEFCAERNVPIAVIQSWLGHTSQEVTRIYARVESMRAKREALAKLPEF